MRHILKQIFIIVADFNLNRFELFLYIILTLLFIRWPIRFSIGILRWFFLQCLNFFENFIFLFSIIKILIWQLTDLLFLYNNLFSNINNIFIKYSSFSKKIIILQTQCLHLLFHFIYLRSFFCNVSRILFISF